MFLLAQGVTAPSGGGPFPPWEGHPPTVHFPIAFLLGAVALDLYAWGRGRGDLARVATGLMAAGVVAGVVAAAAGTVAFFTVPAHTEEAHRLMYWHLGLMAGVVALFAGVFFARHRRTAGPPGAGVRAVGLLGAVLLLVGAYVGGSLVYRGGAGVDPAILAPEVRHGHNHGGEPAPADPGQPEPTAGPPAVPEKSIPKDHRGH
ncbi:MAG: DUF2231 domain-containing protein [Gemmataceae bacterium]|nr:DUF2231 domain-containing protein [Gemmataceae bacterium]